MQERREVEYTENDLIDVDVIPDLNLSGIKIVSCKEPKSCNHKYYVFYCESYGISYNRCPNCGSLNCVKHGTVQDDRVIHDINIGLIRVDIILRIQRFRCADCGTAFREHFDCIPERIHATKRLIEQIQHEALYRPFSNVASEFGYSEGTIRGFFEEYITKLDEERGQIVAPRVLGIDEKHIAHKMRGVFVNVETGELLEMTPDNKRDSVIDTIKKMRGYGKIKIVTMDMANSYKSFIELCLPSAKIVVDKFHVYQALYKKVQTIKTAIMARIAEQLKENPESADTETKTKLRNTICHNSYLFKFSENSLAEKPERLELMAEVCKTFPEFNHLRLLKEGFTRIYDEAKTKEEAEVLYHEWEELIPPKAEKAAKAWEEKYHVPAVLYEDIRLFHNTTENWHTEIFRYFDEGCRVTNAATEGVNRMIQTVDEAGSGYGFKSLRGKCLYGYKTAVKITYSLKKPKKTVERTNPGTVSFYFPSFSLHTFQYVIQREEQLIRLRKPPYVDEEGFYIFDED